MIDKIRATGLLREFGLEVIPTVIVRPGNLTTSLEAQLGYAVTYVGRTASDIEERNLPRIVDVDLKRIIEWSDTLRSDLSIIVQPYAKLEFSTEIAVYGDRCVVEILAGVWELDNLRSPCVGVLRETDVEQLTMPLDGVFGGSPEDASDGGTGAKAHVSAWMIAHTVGFVQERWDGLSGLRQRLGCDLAIKAHYGVGYGLSPQNIRTDVPNLNEYVDKTSIRFGSDPQAPTVASIAALKDTVGPTVHLTVGFAREAAGNLAELVHALRAREISFIELSSGLLSHLAIQLREAGFVVLPRVQVGIIF